jgi:hypothetical protein
MWECHDYFAFYFIGCVVSCFFTACSVLNVIKNFRKNLQSYSSKLQILLKHKEFETRKNGQNNPQTVRTQAPCCSTVQ